MDPIIQPSPMEDLSEERASTHKKRTIHYLQKQEGEGVAQRMSVSDFEKKVDRIEGLVERLKNPEFDQQLSHLLEDLRISVREVRDTSVDELSQKSDKAARSRAVIDPDALVKRVAAVIDISKKEVSAAITRTKSAHPQEAKTVITGLRWLVEHDEVHRQAHLYNLMIVCAKQSAEIPLDDLLKYAQFLPMSIRNLLARRKSSPHEIGEAIKKNFLEEVGVALLSKSRHTESEKYPVDNFDATNVEYFLEYCIGNVEFNKRLLDRPQKSEERSYTRAVEWLIDFTHKTQHLEKIYQSIDATTQAVSVSHIERYCMLFETFLNTSRELFATIAFLELGDEQEFSEDIRKLSTRIVELQAQDQSASYASLVTERYVHTLRSLATDAKALLDRVSITDGFLKEKENIKKCLELSRTLDDLLIQLGSERDAIEEFAVSHKDSPLITPSDIHRVKMLQGLSSKFIEYAETENLPSIAKIAEKMEEANTIAFFLDRALEFLPAYESGDVLLEDEQLDYVYLDHGEKPYSELAVTENPLEMGAVLKEVWKGNVFKVQPYFTGRRKHASIIYSGSGNFKIMEIPFGISGEPRIEMTLTDVVLRPHLLGQVRSGMANRILREMFKTDSEEELNGILTAMYTEILQEFCAIFEQKFLLGKGVYASSATFAGIQHVFRSLDVLGIATFFESMIPITSSEKSPELAKFCSEFISLLITEVERGVNKKLNQQWKQIDPEASEIEFLTHATPPWVSSSRVVPDLLDSLLKSAGYTVAPPPLVTRALCGDFWKKTFSGHV